MLNSKETLQSNTSCCVDDNTGRVLKSSMFYLAPTVQDKRNLLTDRDNHSSVLLENILKQLSGWLSQDEELPKVYLNRELAPIKIAVSEMSLMSFEGINLTDSLSFSCLNNHLWNCSSFGCKDEDHKIQLSIGDYVLDNYLISTSNFEDTITCNSGDIRETLNYHITPHYINKTSPIKVKKIINTGYILISFNISMSSSIVYRQSDNYIQHISQSNLITHLYCCQLMLEEIVLMSHSHEILYGSLFDEVKFFCAKHRINSEKSLSINQNFIFLAATFPIKSSGFDFYCRKNFTIREMPFRLEINSDICSITTYRSSSTDQDIFISNNINSDKTILRSNNPISLGKNKNIISLFKNNFSNDESFSSQGSLKSSHSQTDASFSENSSKSALGSVQSRSYHLLSTDTRLSENINEKIKRPFSSRYKCDRDNSQGSLKEMKSKYFVNNPINNIKYSLSKASQESAEKKATKRGNNHFIMQRSLPSESLKNVKPIFCATITNEVQQIIDSLIEKLIKFVVIDCCNVKLLSINRNFKLGPMSTSSLNTLSTTQSNSKPKTSFQNPLLNRRNKLCNKNESCSLKDSKYNFSQDCRNFSTKRKANNKLIEIKGNKYVMGTNICDLITSQSLFGQPPKSCIKSKYTNKSNIHQIRNLSWDLKKSDERVPSQEKENVRNNQFVKCDSENRPTSIFDFAKARCLSAESPSKINLTNEELIKASKHPFSNSGFIKSVNEGLLSRKSSRLSEKTYCSNFRRNLNRKRTQSSHNNKSMFIPMANNCKYSSRMTNSVANSTVINRLRTDRRRNCNVNALNERSHFSSTFNKHKGETSWNSNCSIGNCNNIFCFS